MGTVFLILILVAYVILNLQLFSAKTPILVFHRGMLAARGIMFICVLAILLDMLVNMIVPLAFGAATVWATALLYLAGIIAPVLYTMVEFSRHGEGLYKEGILLRGFFVPRTKVLDYTVDMLPDTDKAVVTVYHRTVGGLKSQMWGRVPKSVGYELAARHDVYMSGLRPNGAGRK